MIHKIFIQLFTQLLRLSSDFLPNGDALLIYFGSVWCNFIGGMSFCICMDLMSSCCRKCLQVNARPPVHDGKKMNETESILNGGNLNCSSSANIKGEVRFGTGYWSMSHAQPHTQSASWNSHASENEFNSRASFGFIIIIIFPSIFVWLVPIHRQFRINGWKCSHTHAHIGHTIASRSLFLFAFGFDNRQLLWMHSKNYTSVLCFGVHSSSLRIICKTGPARMVSDECEKYSPYIRNKKTKIKLNDENREAILVNILFPQHWDIGRREYTVVCDDEI